MTDTDQQPVALRDKAGRWLPGQPSPNPKGRAPRATEAGLINDLRKYYSGERWRDVVECINYRLAKHDLNAARLVLEYVIGKPSQQVDVNQTGGMEITVRYIGGGGGEVVDAVDVQVTGGGIGIAGLIAGNVAGSDDDD